MRRGDPTGAVAALVVCLLLLTNSVDATTSLATDTANQTSSTGQEYPTTSWALGVVVPEGAKLQDGENLRWGGVTNVTAMVSLPNISLPDRVVYVVLSVMTSDGEILQTAAGVYPNNTGWLAYSWSISDVESVPLNYRWVLNASGPEMAPGARVTVSIFRAPDSWDLRIIDLDTGSSVASSFPSGVASTLKAGDQEVFAFESYSRAGLTFHAMGNLTLWSLTIDGERVTGGCYFYSEWDPSHNPIFVVGSSGTSPPNFISLERAGDGSFLWSYARGWTTNVDLLAGVVGAGLAMVLLVVFSATLTLALWLTRKRAQSPSQI